MMKNERKEANKTCSVGGGPLSSMSVATLKTMAKEKGITGISSMKKADLIKALS